MCLSVVLLFSHGARRCSPPPPPFRLFGRPEKSPPDSPVPSPFRSAQCLLAMPTTIGQGYGRLCLGLLPSSGVAVFTRNFTNFCTIWVGGGSGPSPIQHRSFLHPAQLSMVAIIVLDVDVALE